MAELYLAEDPDEPGSQWVVKRLLPHLSIEQEAIELFLLEARLALRCAGHDNVVRVVGSGSEGGDHYIVMEYIDGEMLADLAGEVPSLLARRPEAGFAILADACAGLEHIHDSGVIHRDVNPRNLLVGADGRTRLIDFGVAAPHPVEGRGHANRGTHAYMAPEQVRGEPMDRRTDVFAVGVILWELATGERLFFRGPSYLTMAAVVNDPVPPLADPALQAVAARALAKDRTQRYASIAELAHDLLDLAGDRIDRDQVADLVIGFRR
jgi:serine/threonine-protein kinase